MENGTLEVLCSLEKCPIAAYGKTYFSIFQGIVRAVDGVSFDVFRGETLGLVGESGSGKTVTGLSILRLVQPPGRIVAGDIQLNGQSLLALSEPQMQDLRGSQISMIFQNPRTALNPVMRIGDQIDRVCGSSQTGSDEIVRLVKYHRAV